MPLVFALVLGRLAENSLCQSMTMSGGTMSIFFTRPISLLFMVLAILAYLSPLIRIARKRLSMGKAETV
jgi:putative tricarboxylic transport membrane protein